MSWVALTVLSFVAGLLLQARVRSPLANPTLIATLAVALTLLLTGTRYADYQAQVEPVSALLAPAVVALAVPLYRLRSLLARQWRPLLLGGVIGTGSAVAADTLSAHGHDREGA